MPLSKRAKELFGKNYGVVLDELSNMDPDTKHKVILAASGNPEPTKEQQAAYNAYLARCGIGRGVNF